MLRIRGIFIDNASTGAAPLHSLAKQTPKKMGWSRSVLTGS
jgi:hypothetical protein